MIDNNNIFQMIMKRFDDQDAKIDDIAKGQEQIKTDLARRNGFLSGALFVFGAVWTFITYVFKGESS